MGRRRRLQVHRDSGSLRGGSTKGSEVVADAVGGGIWTIELQSMWWREEGVHGDSASEPEAAARRT
jgi:hypothetical protein